MTKILDGKHISECILAELKEKISTFKRAPTLAIILCGDNPESIIYTDIKKKRGEEIGIKVDIHRKEKSVHENELLKLIKRLNEEYDGIIIQLPLPRHINSIKVIEAIDPKKDADGLTPFNLGKTLAGEEIIVPATPKGIICLLEQSGIIIKGKNVTIINHSILLGKPLAAMLLNRNATVTVCHEYSTDVKEKSRKADIIVTGVGIPKFITKDMVKQDAIVIDVGICKQGKKILGDVDFESVKEKTSNITPVPGGVGPMTVAMLMKNVVQAYEKNNSSGS